MVKIFYRISPQILSHSLLLLHRRRGIVSGAKMLRYSLFSAFAGLLIAVGEFLMISINKNGEIDKSVLPLSVTLSVASFILISVVSTVLMKKIKEKQIAGNAQLMYDYGFDMKSPRCFSVCADFIENTSGYIKSRIAYDEIECVISDRFAFTVLLEGEEVLISVPKEGQKTDALFEMDNALRERLGERFIYEM